MWWRFKELVCLAKLGEYTTLKMALGTQQQCFTIKRTVPRGGDSAAKKRVLG